MANRSDTFTRADSASALGTPSDAGSDWVADSGTWGITTNQGYKVATGGGFQIATLECSETEGEAEVTIVLQGNAGVIGRAADNNNHILAQVWEGNKIALWKRVSGSYTQLGTTFVGTQSDGDVYLLSIDAAHLITTYQNGVSRRTATDSAGSSNTKWGMMSRDAGTSKTFDDFSFTGAAAGFNPAWARGANSVIGASHAA